MVKKRVFVSLILCFMLVFTGAIFTACKKDAGYDLNNLNTDFTSINYVNIKYNTTYKKIEIDYSKYLLDGNQYLTNEINTPTSPYSVLGKFDTLLQNSMEFTYSFMDNIAKTKNVNTNLRNQTKRELDVLKGKLKLLDEDISVLAEKMEITLKSHQPSTSTTCLDEFEILLSAYSDVLQASYNFNTSISTIYFDYCLTTAKKDYSKINLQDFSTSEGVGNLNARIKEQIVNLTQTYFEENLKSKEVFKQLKTETSDSFNSNFNYALYITDLSKINNVISSVTEDKKQSLLNANIKLYNIQSILNNERDMYKKASNEIDYISVKNDINASNYDIVKAQIIEDHNTFIKHINKTITDILTDLGV